MCGLCVFRQWANANQPLTITWGGIDYEEHVDGNDGCGRGSDVQRARLRR